MTTRRPRPNTTAAGAVACAFGTPWLDHFDPPIGTARGCEACDTADQVTQARLFDLGKGDA